MNYYGYKLEEINELKVVDYNLLVKAMYINEARDKLQNMEIFSYPKMKKETQDKVFRKYNKLAYPSNFEVKNIVKLSDLNKVLK